MSQAGLNVYDAVEDIVNSPAAVIEPHEIHYTQAMRMGGDRYDFNVYLLVANKVTREAQRSLDQYVTGKGPKSIREYIFLNSSLGLPDVDACVERVVRNTYGANYTVGTTKFVGAALRVCVIVT